MNKQGNTYTFIYSIVLVVVVAAILAIVSLSLKPYQDENIENEKRQNILSSVNVSSTPETSAELFNKIITKQFILNYKGEAIEGNAFAVDIPTEGKKLQKALKNPKLQKALKEGTTQYPATFKGNEGFGDRYEQKMVLYGLKDTPANVIVAWIKKADGTTKLTSTYIREAK